MIRNLVYFVYPIQGSIWDWNVDLVAMHLNLFNGRKIVVMAKDERTVSKEDLAARLPRDIDIQVIQNDRNLGETKSFIPALEKIASEGQDQITFYAHAKGVTRLKEVDNIKAWVGAMIRMNLSNPELIEKVMASHSAAGCFRQDYPHWGSQWHYSGSFFWLKHSDVFIKKEWREIYPNGWGVEAWPGRHVPKEMGANLTGDPSIHFTRLYWGEPILPSECDQWLKQLREKYAS